MRSAVLGVLLAAACIAGCGVFGVFLHETARQIVTHRCAEHWFRDTSSLGGLQPDYGRVECDFSSQEERVGCTLPLPGFDAPAYVACRPVAETLIRGACDCVVPED